MFRKILDAISSLFSSLFGSSRKKEKPQPPAPPPPAEEIPQDGSEIKPDTVVIISDERAEPEVDAGELEPVADEEEEETPPVVVPEEEEEETRGRFLWCLDNGHGKQTAGKRSPIFDDGETRLFEYEFNRDIVRRIIAALEGTGIQIFNVVPEVDVDDFLQERVDRVNSRASALPKIFVSVHSNAAPTRSSQDWCHPSISGIETWFYHGSEKGRKIAGIFQRHLIEKTSWENRHLKSRPQGQFYVLRKTRMPAVLTENGFYNNKAQALELMKDEVRQTIADAHVAAILEIEQNGITGLPG